MPRITVWRCVQRPNAEAVGFLASLWMLGRRKGFGGLVQALVVFALLAILTGMLLPALAKSKSKSNRISSVKNLKNIGLAARIFATEHGGRMPGDFSEMKTELTTDKILVHPTTGERYTWVGAGKTEEQSERIIAYGPAVEGNREVLFSDGSVQQVTARQFDEMLVREMAANAPTPVGMPVPGDGRPGGTIAIVRAGSHIGPALWTDPQGCGC